MNRRRAVRDGSMKLTDDSGKIEMFDLAADPREKSDLANRGDSADRRQALLAKLEAWEDDVAAPRLRDFRPRAK